MQGLCETKNINQCLNIAIKRSYWKLGIFLVCLLILSPILIYCLYQIINAYRIYKAQEDAVTKENPQQKLAGHFSILDASNDNNDDPVEKLASNTVLPDEYTSFTKAIQDSFSSYKDYNTTITNYYKKTRHEDPPDLMDPNVLISENDDW